MSDRDIILIKRVIWITIALVLLFILSASLSSCHCQKALNENSSMVTDITKEDSTKSVVTRIDSTRSDVSIHLEDFTIYAYPDSSTKNNGTAYIITGKRLDLNSSKNRTQNIKRELQNISNVEIKTNATSNKVIDNQSIYGFKPPDIGLSVNFILIIAGLSILAFIGYKLTRFFKNKDGS